MSASILDVLHAEPGVGLSFLNRAGRVVRANQCAAARFAQSSPEGIVGRTVHDVLGPEAGELFAEMFASVEGDQVPVMLRSTWNGCLLHSTMRLVSDQGALLLLVVTTEGEPRGSAGRDFRHVDTPFVHLGPLDVLTRRELEVLVLLAEGMSAEAIAKELHRSRRTVEGHSNSLRLKLGAANRVQLVELSLRAGLRLEDTSKPRVVGFRVNRSRYAASSVAPGQR